MIVFVEAFLDCRAALPLARNDNFPSSSSRRRDFSLDCGDPELLPDLHFVDALLDCRAALPLARNDIAGTVITNLNDFQ